MKWLFLIPTLAFAQIGRAPFYVSATAAAPTYNISAVASQAAGDVNTASSITLAFPNNVTAGNMIIVWGLVLDGDGAAALPTVAKSAGSATIGSVDQDADINNAPSNGFRAGIWRALVTGTGSLTMILDGGAQNDNSLIIINEYTKSGGSFAVDNVAASNSGTASVQTTGANVVISGGGNCLAVVIGWELSTTDFTYINPSDVSVYNVGTGNSTLTAWAQHKITTAGTYTITIDAQNSWAFKNVWVTYKAQ